MRSKVTRWLLVPVVALAVGGVAAPAYAAGEDKGLCNEKHDRVSIPDSFPLDVCFDGKTLFLYNSTEIALDLTLAGDGVGQPERSTRAGALDARFLDFIQPGVFSRQPQINGPDFRSGVVPQKYLVKVPIGDNKVTVSTGAADMNTQRLQMLVKVIFEYAPSGAKLGAVKAIVELGRELIDVGEQHAKCLDRNTNAWGDLGCNVLKGRNVAFAIGRAGVDGLGSGVVAAVTTTIDMAWGSFKNVKSFEDVKRAKKTFTIKAVEKQAPPPPPPAGNTGGNEGSNPGGNQGGNNGGNTGGGNNPPPPPPNPNPEPKTIFATVQNKHLAGADGLEEDSTPAYLSTVAQPRCKGAGCAIGGTDMWSDDTVEALCWVDGVEMTNENRNTSADDNNPHKVTSTRWLKAKKNGQVGLISYIYLTPQSRDAVGHC